MKSILTPVLFLSCVGLGCGSSLPHPELERFDIAATPNPSDYPDAQAVILLDRAELRLTVDGRTGNPIARLRRLYRVKILTEAGKKLAQLVVPYEPGTAIHGLSARSVSEGGRIEDADPDNIADSQELGWVRAKTLFVPAVEVGSVVEMTYDQYIEDPRFIAPWAFQSALPTVRSELAVIVPGGFSVDLRFSENGAFVSRPPERFETPEGTRFSWSQTNLPPIYPEPNMPQPSLLAPRAHVVFLSAKVRGRTFNGLRSWDDVAGWFVSKMPNWAELSEATRAEAMRVAGDAPKLEKALKIMEVLARDLGPEPGPVPPLWRARLLHPDSVLQYKKANPTSRGLLFVSLLRAVGLDAVPGLYVYRDEDLILPDLPTVRALDGVCAVLQTRNGPVVLDPSQPLVSAQVPAARLQGTRMVALTADGAQVMRVPVGQPDDSVTEIRYDLRLDPRGDVYGPLKANLTGTEAAALRARLLGAAPESYAEQVSAFLAERGVAFDVETVSIADLEALRRPLGLTARINARGFLQGEGTELFVPLRQVVGQGAEPLPEVRRSDLRLGAPSKVELRATLTLPEEYELDNLPEPSEVTWAGESVSLKVRAETRRRLGFVRVRTRVQPEVSKKQYRAFRRYRESLSVAEDTPFTIRRPPPRTMEF